MLAFDTSAQSDVDFAAYAARARARTAPSAGSAVCSRHRGPGQRRRRAPSNAPGPVRRAGAVTANADLIQDGRAASGGSLNSASTCCEWSGAGRIAVTPRSARRGHRQRDAAVRSPQAGREVDIAVDGARTLGGAESRCGGAQDGGASGGVVPEVDRLDDPEDEEDDDPPDLGGERRVLPVDDLAD